jgi:hypothetical protein
LVDRHGSEASEQEGSHFFLDLPTPLGHNGSMDQRDDYSDLDLPPPCGMVTFFSRRRWEWLVTLLVVNVLAFGAWRVLYPTNACNVYSCGGYPFRLESSDGEGFYLDPIEYDPSAQEAISAAEIEAEQELAVIGMTPGPVTAKHSGPRSNAS